MPQSLLAEIDRRAAALGLNRSQYLAALARRDVASCGDLTLSETESAPAPPPEQPVNYRNTKRGK